MKLKNLFTSLCAAVAMLASCAPEGPVALDNIKVSSTYITLPLDGASSKEVTATVNGDWTIAGVPEWLTVTPLSGEAGTHTITFSAAAYSGTGRFADLQLTCANETQALFVIQGVKPSIKNTKETAYTADEAIALYLKGEDLATEIYVKGKVIKASTDLGYGNAEFYLEESNADYSFEFYRCVDLGNKKFEKDYVKKGDEIIAYGTLTKYNSTIELAQGCYLVEYKEGEPGDEPTEAKVSEFLAATVGETVYQLSGFITNRTDIAGHKFDLVDYGNFDLTDATGNVYVYGVGARGDIAKLGVKAGDIITINGTRADYKGTPQVGDGQYVSHKSVTDATAAQAAALSDDDKNDPKNYIRLTGKVTNGTAIAGHKFDLENYGNFDLVDESGSIYVYGVTTGWNGESKKFSTLGVKEGDIITIVAYKTSYQGNAQVVGMYVSHEEDLKNYPSAETSWRYDIPGDSDGGFMLLTFIDDTNCYLTSGDKDGIWWDPADGYSEGTYQYDPVENLGAAFSIYSLQMLPNGQLSVYGGAFIMNQVEYIPKPEAGKTVTFTFNTAAGIAELNVSAPAAGAGTRFDGPVTKDGITLSATTAAGKTDTRIWNSSGNYDLRIYANSTLVFAATTGKKITKIELAGSAVNGFSADGFNSGTWTGNASSVTLTATATGKINTATVTYVEE